MHGPSLALRLGFESLITSGALTRLQQFVQAIVTHSTNKDSDQLGQAFTWMGRSFVRAVVPSGDNKGRTFTIAQPLAGRYQIARFFASGGMGLLLEGSDLRTGCRCARQKYSQLRYDDVRQGPRP